MNNTFLTATLVATGLLGGGAAWAQVAGSTTTSAAPTESTQVAMGWSAKKAILGKVVYTESGQPIGKVDDLIISPEKNLSYFIVGAGGFVGIGRHDVAIPVSQIKGVNGRLVMPGVTKDVLKAMPEFSYTPDDEAQRLKLQAAVELEMTHAQDRLVELEKKAATATADGRRQLAQQKAALQTELKSLQARAAEMNKAGARRWRSFEANVSAALARLHKAVESAIG
ncbi:MAG: PRC-barrel domain-containing protein [Burkholderiales bacterium]|nr:PRC-barrel domain-containing protein [Burkholderiales bacterium]